MSRATVMDALRSSRQHTLSNATVLDHIATPQHPRSHSVPDQCRSPSPETPQPISKHVLSAVFSALDRAPSNPNYVFVENTQENHFLYGLVLPLIARVLAVSCPGLLAIVQLPRSDMCPEWATQSSDDGYGSNGSNASKSNAATTNSFGGTSRTPSPSDDGNSTDERKSNSPEPTANSQVLKHPEQHQQQKHQQQQNNSRPDPAADRTSPSPDAVNQDYRALRLLCNGFEVLTGKMPPPRKHMGRFTLATVGWEKAAVIQPSHPSRGLSMSFSNGMVTPTEGIVVTFSNGSLCLLTLCDPLSDLQALKVSHETPVVVFTFATAGQLSIGELISKDESSLTEAAMRVKSACEKTNFMFVEIGHGAGPRTNSSTPESLPDSHNARRENAKISEPPNVSKPESVQSSQERPSIPRYIPIDAVPRAIPLFVNTINQCFIDPPYQDIPEHAYENALINDRYRVDREQPQEQPQEQQQKQQQKQQQEQPQEQPQEQHASSNPYPTQADTVNASENLVPEAQQKGSAEQAVRSQQTVPNGVPKSMPSSDEKGNQANKRTLEAAGLKSAPSSRPESSHREANPSVGVQTNYPAMYGYYGYRPDHAYPRAHQGSHNPLSSRVLQHPIEVDGNHLHSNHNAYFYSHPTNGVIPNGAYAHQSASSYAVGAYYTVGPHHRMPHQLQERTPGWHQGMPMIPHRTEQVPNSHLVHHPRSDVHLAYSAHRQLQPAVGGQFASRYYVVPPSSQIYGPTPTQAMQHPKQPGPSYSYAETYNGVAQTEGAAIWGPSLTANHERVPSSSPPAISRAKGSTVTSKPLERNTAQREENKTSILREESEIDEEKEEALQVLVGMRGGAVRRGKVADSGVPKESKDCISNAQKHESVCPNGQAPSRKLKTFVREVPVVSEGSKKIHNQVPSISNGVQASPSHRHGLKRQQRNNDTQSSTSTNSQGTMLMKGAVTGNSHVPNQGYNNWKPKRQRKR
eukprot:TRINITY_DN1340_c0_g1_i1.p1 TRINITY_DN1340_c0_g1~~TRINITY_DN1340_c0_g1_i1.p1  ORF type:complete len:972 (+),score=152.12 TRINITY_DN1340_c0_g1_i1:560-3475(+)